MSRSSSLHLMSWLGIIGSVFQIIGCFLPFVVMKNGLNQPTLPAADSLWASMTHTITGQIPSLYALFMVYICLFLLAMLISLLTALAVLLNKWQRFFLTFGLLFALLGLLGVDLAALFHFALNGWCGPEAMSAANCTFVSGGPGLWLTSCGFLLSLGCFIVSNLLYREPVPVYG